MKITIGPKHLEREFAFTIPEVDNIGIFMSGGLDSSAMLSLILKELDQTDRLKTVSLTAFTVEKPTGETMYATRILKQFEDHFQVSILHVNNIPNTEEAIRQGRMDSNVVAETCKQFNGQIYLSGNNMPSPDIKTFKGGLGFTYKQNPLYEQPFLNLLKPHMTDILYKLGTDFIIPYTHSCSRQLRGKCNLCYSCEERSWGFEELELEDPETIDL
jgi:7-cyano-7-deazaguanine synthase in queuosine biosynthesis